MAGFITITVNQACSGSDVDYLVHEADNESLPEIVSSQFITGFIATLDALFLHE